MPLQSESFVEWENRGWHGLMLDAGCTLWDQCGGCPIPICAEDIGPTAARAEAIRLGIQPMQRPVSSRLPERPRSDSDYQDRLRPYYYQRASIREAAIATNLDRATISRIYTWFNDHQVSRVPEWTEAMWEAVR